MYTYEYLEPNKGNIRDTAFVVSVHDDVFEKVYGGSKQIAVSESAGASPIWQRRASLGCGPSRPTGEVLCRAIVLDRVLIGDRVTTCRISTL